MKSKEEISILNSIMESYADQQTSGMYTRAQMIEFGEKLCEMQRDLCVEYVNDEELNLNNNNEYVEAAIYSAKISVRDINIESLLQEGK